MERGAWGTPGAEPGERGGPGVCVCARACRWGVFAARVRVGVGPVGVGARLSSLACRGAEQRRSSNITITVHYGMTTECMDRQTDRLALLTAQ